MFFSMYKKIRNAIIIFAIGLFLIWIVCEMALLKTDALLSALDDPDNDIRRSALKYIAGTGKDDCEKVVTALLKHSTENDKTHYKVTPEPTLTLLKIRSRWDKVFHPAKTLDSRVAASYVICQIGDPAKEVVQKLTSDKEYGTTAVSLLKNWNPSLRW